MSEPQFISANQVKQKLTMPKAIDAMRLAYQDLSSGKAIVPDRTQLHTSSSTHYLVMPAHFPSGGITTVKSVSLNGENPRRGLPFIQAMILAFDDETGEPLAIIDGSEVTAIRTAAASGLATDLFASPNAKIGGIFGTGALAKPHLEALSTVRVLDRIYVWGRTFGKSRDFCNKWSKDFEVELIPTDDLKYLKEVDVLCTTTTSQKPLFEHNHLKRGVHINAVGVYKPDYQEIPSETIVEAEIYIDQLEGALSEAGDLLIPMSKGQITKEHFSKEIGSVLLEELSYQWNAEKISLFKSVGNAIQDAAAVKVILS